MKEENEKAQENYQTQFFARPVRNIIGNIEKFTKFIEFLKH